MATALVDAEDFESANAHRWSLKSQVKGPGYAYRAVRIAGGKQLRIYLHREVMGLTRGDKDHIDHISRDTLDDRKSNLRFCTHAQNRQNTSGWSKSSSRYRGVSWEKSRQKWKGQVMLNYKNHVVGRFDTEEEADAAVKAFRAQHMPFSTD